jgi:hypothetical protein
MKSSLNLLILIFLLTAIFSEIYGDFFFLKPFNHSVVCSQPDRDLMNEADSPFCFDTDAKDFLNWHPKSEAEPTCFSTDHRFSMEVFQLSTYSLFIWQPPKIA